MVKVCPFSYRSCGRAGVGILADFCGVVPARAGRTDRPGQQRREDAGRAGHRSGDRLAVRWIGATGDRRG
jgi:hypothetical protein